MNNHLDRTAAEDAGAILQYEHHGVVVVPWQQCNLERAIQLTQRI